MLCSVISGCSTNFQEREVRAVGAKSDFERRLAEYPPTQPVAVRPSEMKKVQRASRVLRVYRGVASTTETSESMSNISASNPAAMPFSTFSNDLASIIKALEVKISSPEANSPQETNLTRAIPDSALNENLNLSQTGIALSGANQLASTFEKSIKSKATGTFTFSGMNIAVALNQLARKVDANIVILPSEAIKSGNVTRQFNGKITTYMDQIANDNGLKLIWSRKSNRGWVVSREAMPELQSRSAYLSSNAQKASARRDYSVIIKMIDTAQRMALEANNGNITSAEFRSLASAFDSRVQNLSINTRLQASNALFELKQKLSTINQTLTTTVTPSNAVTPSNTVMTGAAAVTETQCLAPGEVVKVEKIFTAFIKPDEVKTSLETDLKSLLSGSQAGATTPPASPEAAPSESNCDTITQLSVQADQTGILVTGKDSEIAFIKNLLDGIDAPKKQILVQVYLVQVTANWRRQVESTFTSSGQIGNAMLSLAGVGSAASSATLFTLSGRVGDVLGALEENNIGRTISSPSILVLDGKSATVDRTRTLRYQETPAQTTDPDTNVVTTPQPVWQDLDLKLTLDITANVVPSNNHVLLDFKLQEDSIDSETDPEEQGQTKNSITTNIETSPGDVVVLAGLYRQNKAADTDALPFASDFGELNGLLGGASDKVNNQSELLVFIAPTVLEPGQQANTPAPIQPQLLPPVSQAPAYQQPQVIVTAPRPQVTQAPLVSAPQAIAPNVTPIATSISSDTLVTTQQAPAKRFNQLVQVGQATTQEEKSSTQTAPSLDFELPRFTTTSPVPVVKKKAPNLAPATTINSSQPASTELREIVEFKL